MHQYFPRLTSPIRSLLSVWARYWSSFPVRSIDRTLGTLNQGIYACGSPCAPIRCWHARRSDRHMTCLKPWLDCPLIKPDEAVDFHTRNLAQTGPGVDRLLLHLKPCGHVFNGQERHRGVGTTSADEMSAPRSRRGARSALSSSHICGGTF